MCKENECEIVKELTRKLELLNSELEKYKKHSLELMVRIEEQERRLGLNSSNSSKPPSSDGLKKPLVRTSSLRGKSDRKSGGQEGHVGKTLERTETPNYVEDYIPDICQYCGAVLEMGSSIKFNARQVFDLPQPRPVEVTEHRAHVCCCDTCGKHTAATFPEGVNAPVQYGQRIMTAIAYLQGAHFMPEDRLSELMCDLFGVQVSAATVGNLSSHCAERLKDADTHIHDLLSIASLKHMDETGFRINGKLQWLHVLSNVSLTHYRISSKRGDVPKNISGIVIHDHWKPYYTIQGVIHALCNSHHLRELKALTEIEKEDWARKMGNLLHRACRVKHLVEKHGKSLLSSLIQLIDRTYDRIIAEGLKYHLDLPPLEKSDVRKRGKPKKRTGHNMLIRLQERKDDVLRFLVDSAVPFTNNQAEQDVRMMKLKQKISGGFRSENGANFFAILRGIISTARKQGWNVLNTLSMTSSQVICQLQTNT